MACCSMAQAYPAKATSGGKAQSSAKIGKRTDTLAQIFCAYPWSGGNAKGSPCQSEQDRQNLVSPIF